MKRFVILSAFLLLSFFAARSSGKEISIKGIVKDSLGNLLSGVDIFLSSDDFNQDILNTRTDEKGRYTLGKISPGAYKVAAAKRGYLTNVENINTSSEASLDLTLKPLPPGAARQAEKFPDALDWIRRIPRKDILKEVEAVSIVESRGADDKDRIVAHRAIARSYSFATADSLPFLLDLRQVATREISGKDQEGSGDRKNSMELSLSGNIGPDFEMEFEGQKKRWKGSSDGDSSFKALKRDAELIGFVGSYDFGGWGELDFKTFYGSDSLSIKNNAASASLIEGDQQGWGYSAGWQKKEEDISYEIRMSHSGLEFHGDLPYTGPEESHEGEWNIENQVLNASGSFQVSLTADHKIDLGVKTRFYDNSYPIFRILSPYDARSSYGPGEMGKQVSIQGKDYWVIFAPVTIGLGLSYQHFYNAYEAQVISPILEVEYRGKSGSSLKTEISYPIDQTRTDDGVSEWFSSGSDVPSDHERSLSCKIGLKKEFRDGSINARASYVPLLLFHGEEDFLGMPWSDVALYITDGNASLMGAGVFFEKKFKLMDGGIGLDYGEVEGTFSTVLPDDIPLQMFRQGNLNYLLAILKAYSSKSDTEFFLRYRKVKDSLYEEGASGNDIPFQYSMISLQLNQNIPVIKIKGVRLRAVLEYDDVLAYEDAGSDPLASLLIPDRRIGGGLWLNF